MLATLSAVFVSFTAMGRQIALPLLLGLPVLFVFVGKIASGIYERDELLIGSSTLDEAPALFQLATLFTLVTWLSENQMLGGSLRPEQVLVYWVSLLLFLLTFRSAARAISPGLVEPERCIVLGSEPDYRRIGAKLPRSVALLGFVTSEPRGPNPAGDDLGSVADLARIVEKQEVHRIVMVPGAASDSAVDVIRLVKTLGVRISVVPHLIEVVGAAFEQDHLPGLTLLGVRPFGLSRSSAVLKRSMDVAGATLGLLALAPVFAFIAVAVRLDSRGPLFFRQRRVGQDGKQFEMLKFRTMIDGADALKAQLAHLNEAGAGMFKIRDDPRITRVGRLLRSTSLDELPQLVNVLQGEMSLVGPRPLVEDDDRQVLGWHRQRLHLTPGMTGPWQVLGSSRVPLQEMVTLDYLYVSNWSLWADVRILLRTVKCVFGASGQ